jgi:hypothetical protein
MLKKSKGSQAYGRLKAALQRHEAIIGRYPLNVQIQTVSSCNGKCLFCPYHGSWHQKHPGRMDWVTYEKIIHNLKHFTIGKFCPYFENEPLLDREIFERIRYALVHLKPALTEVSTNLSVLDDRMLSEIEKIFPMIPHEIWVSFHGVNKESYQEIMGLDFTKVLDSVRRLVTVAQRVPLNIVIRGAGTPKIQQDKTKVWFGEKEYLSFWDRQLSDFEKKPRISFFPYHDRADAKPLRAKGMSFGCRFRKDSEGFYCVRFDRWVHFLYTGEPVLCCMDYDRETAFQQTICQKSLAELYSSPAFLDLVKKGIGMMASEDDFICKRCSSPGG